MALPIRTTVEDVQALCNYLLKKPTGATVKEAKAVIKAKHLDGRKLTALRFWGLIEGEDRLKLTARGRESVRNHGQKQAQILADVVRSIPAYRAVVERASHRSEASLTAHEVAAHWHEHNPDDASKHERTLNDQAVCFFQLAAGAALGELVIGRRGSPTRFEFDLEAAAAFSEGAPIADVDASGDEEQLEDTADRVKHEDDAAAPAAASELGQGIFLAHGKKKKPLDQLKSILDQFKVPYKVAVDEPHLGRPIGQKVKETMQACNCAILLFTADEEFHDRDGNTVWRPSENVVYELGAASYLYGKRIVILKEESVEFPTNFKELGYISFGPDQLQAKSMDLFRELIGLEILKIST